MDFAFAPLSADDLPLIARWLAEPQVAEWWGPVEEELPKIEAGFNHVVRVDETHNHGGAHLYLGILNSLRPPSMGGKPEVGRGHFERSARARNSVTG